jgi:hypothetical protein
VTEPVQSVRCAGSARSLGDFANRRVAGPLALLTALLVTWVAWRPPSPDLAAQVYRLRLFSADGFSLWDNGWYGGHYVPDYSLMLPPLAYVAGLRWIGVAAATASTLIFWQLASRREGFAAPAATAVFALGAVGDLFIGRIAFALGVAFGMASVLAMVRGRRVWSGVLSLGCAAASPVAAAFLILVGCAELSSSRSWRRAAVLAGPALALTLTLMALFPEGGYEPFGLPSLAAAAGAGAAVLVLLPARERLLRYGAGLYLIGLGLSFVVRSPMGSNAVRLGVLLAPAILVGAVRREDVERCLTRAWRWLGAPPALAASAASLAAGAARRSRPGRTPAAWVLALVTTALVLWQINGPLSQSVEASLDPASEYSFYVPVIRFLDSRLGGAPVRIEVPFTRSHWETSILGTRFALARGWERQLDTRYDGLFYAPHLTAAAYRAWLLDTAVRFVALPHAAPDFSSVQEGALIRAGLPFLREVFRSANWHVYEVVGARPLASGPGSLTAMDADGFTLSATRPGSFVVRIRYTPRWQVSSGAAVVTPGPDGWTQVTAPGPGPIAVDVAFGLTL